MNREETMRPRRLFIHCSFSGCSVFEADVHEVLHFSSCFDYVHGEILDEHSFVGRLLELHPGLSVFT